MDIDSLLDRFRKSSVLVLGDIMLDVYLWGAVDRLSPEAPVPVVDVRRQTSELGGAGNVARNVMALGASVVMATVVGQDSDGDVILEGLTKYGITTAVVRDPGRVTTRKVRVVSEGGAQQLIRLDWETRRFVEGLVKEELVNKVRSLISDVDVLVISDYAKGVLSRSVLQEVLHLANEAGCPVVVDPKGSDYRYYRGVKIITPNLQEAQVASGVNLKTPADLWVAATRLLEASEAESILITQGSEGMTLFSRTRRPVYIPSVAREVYDVTGAGDTVVAVMALGIAAQISLEEAARIANVAAGIVVGKRGTATVSPIELRAALLAGEGPVTKQVDQDSLVEILREKRRTGARIVFTNGCFDLLHAGHITYLERAKQLGDILVVALNSDASVRRLKGPQRPILSQQERALLLGALRCVDYVVIFEEDTPLELIKAVEPDVLVKGKDYSLESVVGRDVVERRGGTVVLMDLVEGLSTTQRIQEIVGRFAIRPAEKG